MTRAHHGGMGVSYDSPGSTVNVSDEPLYIIRRTMRKLLTMNEASEYLGISKLTLYGWVSERKLGFIKVGRLVKFKQEHLDRWIDQHTVKARPAAHERVDASSEHR